MQLYYAPKNELSMGQLLRVGQVTSGSDPKNAFPFLPPPRFWKRILTQGKKGIETKNEAVNRSCAARYPGKLRRSLALLLVEFEVPAVLHAPGQAGCRFSSPRWVLVITARPAHE